MQMRSRNQPIELMYNQDTSNNVIFLFALNIIIFSYMATHGPQTISQNILIVSN